MTKIKIILEKHADGYVGYPLGLKGVIVGQGDSYEEALADVKSAIVFHIETFGCYTNRNLAEYDQNELDDFCRLNPAYVPNGYTNG